MQSGNQSFIQVKDSFKHMQIRKENNMSNTIKFQGEELSLEFGRYANTNLISLQLYDREGMAFMHASCNIQAVPDVFKMVMDPTIPMMAVKDWSENKGIEKALVDHGIVTTLVGTMNNGYVDCNIYQLNEKYKPDDSTYHGDY